MSGKSGARIQAPINGSLPEETAEVAESGASGKTAISALLRPRNGGIVIG